MYKSVSRVELCRPSFVHTISPAKVLPHERHKAGYGTAAVSSSSRVFGT